MKCPQSPQPFGLGFGLLEHLFKLCVNLGRIQFPDDRSVMKNDPGMTHIPIIGMFLHLNQFQVAQ